MTQSTCRGTEGVRTHFFSRNIKPPTQRYESFSASMPRSSSPATPHCITAQALSICLGSILSGHQGCLTSEPCPGSCTARLKRRRGLWAGGGRGERSREQLNVIFGSRRHRDSKSQAVEGVGGGALQQRCRSCGSALIGCFAIRDEGQVAPLCGLEMRHRGEPGGRLLETGAQIHLSDIAGSCFRLKHKRSLGSRRACEV